MEKYLANISVCYLCNANNEIPKMVKYTAPVERTKMDQEWYPSSWDTGSQEVTMFKCYFPAISWGLEGLGFI